MHIRDDANWIGQSARVSYYGRVEEEEETYSQRRGSGSVNLFRWTHCCLYLCAVQSVCLYLFICVPTIAGHVVAPVFIIIQL